MTEPKTYADVLKDFWREPTEEEVKKQQEDFIDFLENLKISAISYGEPFVSDYTVHSVVMDTNPGLSAADMAEIIVGVAEILK